VQHLARISVKVALVDSCPGYVFPPVDQVLVAAATYLFVMCSEGDLPLSSSANSRILCAVMKQ